MERAKVKDFKQEYGSALVCWILANINRDVKKHPEPFSPMDFISPHLLPRAVRSHKLTYTQLSAKQQRAVLAGFFGHTVKGGKIVPLPKPKKEKKNGTSVKQGKGRR